VHVGGGAGGVADGGGFERVAVGFAGGDVEAAGVVGREAEGVEVVVFEVGAVMAEDASGFAGE